MKKRRVTQHFCVILYIKGFSGGKVYISRDCHETDSKVFLFKVSVIVMDFHRFRFRLLFVPTAVMSHPSSHANSQYDHNRQLLT